MANFRRQRIWFYAKRAFWIFISWVLISNLLFFYDLITLSSKGALDSTYDFTSRFLSNLVTAVSAGLIGGLVTVNLIEYWLRKYAFWKAVLLTSIIYTITAILISGAGAIYLGSEELGLSVWDSEVWEEASFIFGSWTFLKYYIIWLFIVLATLVLLMINDKYGPGVFPDYLKGKYFTPKREQRIFMFADIKNATGIAETIGEEKYFYFLKDFFNHITPAITETKGEIYQYVGDEIVISWKMKKGLDKGNAIYCFYKMKKLLEKKVSYYSEKYNSVATFKVGLHFGWVMVGELGQVKREIAFSGDVLNTTSRIQAKCNDLRVDILASEEFLKINHSLPKGIVPQSIGMQKLKGKEEEIALVTFRNKV